MALNWLVGPHRDFGRAWATSPPNQATVKETAINCPLQPNISTYYHKVIFVCLVPIKSCRPKSLKGRLTGSKMRTGHFYGMQIGSRCEPPLPPLPPCFPPEGCAHLFLITSMGESSLWTGSWSLWGRMSAKCEKYLLLCGSGLVASLDLDVYLLSFSLFASQFFTRF